MTESINPTLDELPEEPEVVISQPQESVEQIDSSANTTAESDQQGWFKTSVQSAKRIAKGAALTVEMLPITNEGARYGALAATEVMTRNPLIGAAVLGGTTLVIEGAGALAASEFITGKTGSQVFDWLNKKLDKFVPEDAKMSRVVESGVAMTFGTPVLMAAQQKQNPNRTNAEARKQGLLTAAWMAGVFAVEGALISEGIGASGLPAKIGAAAVVTGSLVALPKWVKKQIIKNNTGDKNMNETNVVADSYEGTPPIYNLSPEELKIMDQELVDLVKEKYGQEGLVGVWISPKNRLANLIRNYEASYFPEVEEVTSEEEEHTLFFAIIDPRPSTNRVVHAATITGVSYKSNDESLIDGVEQDDKSTGFYTVDSLIDQGNFTPQEFYDYYSQKGVDVKKCIAVETNFKVGEPAEKYNGFRPSDLAYLMFFKMLEKRNPATNGAMVIATINRASAISFQRVGLDYEPLMGKENLLTEESLLGKDSLPVVLPYNDININLFESMGLKLPELFI